MIRLSNLTLARGALRLFENASLTVHAGHRVGIVGPNGSGKSSLFALLRGELLPEAGSVDLPPRWTIAHVAQETPAVDRAALDFVLDGDVELRAVEAALAAEERAHAMDGHALAELHHRFEAIGGYAARARAAELLAGLGVTEARHADPVATFSGGWRMRLNLAQALAARSDLLLLDEPTNHLDLDAVLWLEDWLKRYPGTLLLVTHDRDFLDAVAQSIVHVDGRKLRHYGGNYSAFERERAAQLALQQAAYAKQQRQIAHLQSFVDRFRAKATKAKQAQSRLKTLERMERIAAAHVDSPFEFAFAPAGTHARQLVRLEHATLRYGAAAPVFEDLELSVLSGDRIGLLGPNGAGKSTLVKALAGTMALARGERHVAQNLAIGYFAQHQLEQLDPGASPLLHLQRLDPGARDQALRDFLGGFDFRGAMADSPVAQFSGGEKARLVLAMIVRRRPQLLILDEPTNHLDIEMREALAEALQDFDGALIVVAHDRHLIAATTDTLLLVDRGRVAPFDGDLDDYRDWVLALRRRGSAGEAADRAADAPDRRSVKRAEAEARQKRSDARKPLVAQQAKIEGEMRALEAEKAALDAWLATPEAYADDAKERLRPAVERAGEITWELARREAAWLELAEALDRIDAPG
ncbi:MAG TPA: ATP-binding cassette domain-containing protein [Casimicrobiaceae bacterium]|nr:ATP-binding cassette domain-containing protein [Casimicrobiaceae bacterium]